MKARKMLIFSTTQGHFLLDSMSLAGCQINQIDVNFHLQKVWNFLIKIQLTKYNPERTRGGKCPPSCQLGLTKNVQNRFPIILRYSNFFDLCSCLCTICHRHQLYIFLNGPHMKNQYRSFLCMEVFTDFLVSKALCNNRFFAELELKVGHWF